MVSENNFFAIPSTQNQITLIGLFSFSFFALSLDHFFTPWTACLFLIKEGSNPTESIILNGTSSLSYISRYSVVPLVPQPVFAFSSPKTALIKVDFPTPELLKRFLSPLIVPPLYSFSISISLVAFSCNYFPSNPHRILRGGAIV